MTLTLATARDLLDTGLNDSALQTLIDAVNADVTRLGGAAYPLLLSGARLDIAAVSAAGADRALARAFFRGAPTVGTPLIRMTETALVEVAYTLTALDAGPVAVTIDGDGGGRETLSGLADGALAELSFYLAAANGRIELPFDAAEDADPAAPDRVVWRLPSARQDAARTLLTGIAERERVRFAIARAHAGLIMPPGQWQAALDRIALACLRIAVSDEGVASISERGGDAQQALRYLAYSSEYSDRLNQVLALTGGYLA